MCWECDNPHRTRSDYLEYLRGIIDRCGWAVLAIEGTRRSPGFAYTVGLSEFGEAELAVWGLPQPIAHQLLNDLAEHVVHASGFEPGQQVQLVDGPLVEFVALSQPSAHLLMADTLFGPGVRAVQVVYADERGRWPWDSSYRAGRGGQPVLGLRKQLPVAGLPPI